MCTNEVLIFPQTKAAGQVSTSAVSCGEMYVIAALVLGANFATVNAAPVLTCGKTNTNFVEPLNPLRIRIIPDSARRSSSTPVHLGSVDVPGSSSSSTYSNEHEEQGSSMTSLTEPRQKTQHLLERSEPFARPPNRHIGLDGFFGDIDDPDHIAADGDLDDPGHIADLMNDADFFNQHIHPNEPGDPEDLMHNPHPIANEPADLMGNVPGNAAEHASGNAAEPPGGNTARHAGGNALEGEGQHMGGAPSEEDSDLWDAFH